MMIVTSLSLLLVVSLVWLWVCRSDAKYWKKEHDSCEDALFSYKEKYRELSSQEKKAKLDLQCFIEGAEEKEYELKEAHEKTKGELLVAQETLRQLETDYTSLQKICSQLEDDVFQWKEKYQEQRKEYIALWKSIYDILSSQRVENNP